MAKATNFDRTAEDLGNIIELEHVNVMVPDQGIATLFYVVGLGLTRDPYLMPNVTNMWINAGRNQFHLPTQGSQVLRGRIGLVVPALDRLVERLKGVKNQLKATRFAYKRVKGKSYLDVTCPWGNRFRCHKAGSVFSPMGLGIAYVQFDVPRGTSRGIVRFYREMFGAQAKAGKWDRSNAARVSAGFCQELIFRETNQAIPEFDQHHIQIYVVDFSGPYSRLMERGLISEESNQHQYRFEDITDLDTGDVLFTIDHEIRSMTHPLYGRPKVNRNPDQNNRNFVPGYETSSWAMQ